MRPTFSLAQLRSTKAGEYAVRFLFGGVVSLLAALVADAYGPSVGGLFLAFPALLPAGLTLVKQHDGRQAAANDARGAVVGSWALAGFALLVWRTTACAMPWLTLLLACALWLLLSVSLWWCLLKDG